MDSEVLEFYNRIGQQEHTQSWKQSLSYSLDKHIPASIYPEIKFNKKKNEQEKSLKNTEEAEHFKKNAIN